MKIPQYGRAVAAVVHLCVGVTGPLVEGANHFGAAEPPEPLAHCVVEPAALLLGETFFLGTEVTNVVLVIHVIVAAIPADVEPTGVALASAVEDEAKSLAATDAAVLVECGLLGQHLCLVLLVVQCALD